MLFTSNAFVAFFFLLHYFLWEQEKEIKIKVNCRKLKISENENVKRDLKNNIAFFLWEFAIEFNLYLQAILFRNKPQIALETIYNKSFVFFVVYYATGGFSTSKGKNKHTQTFHSRKHCLIKFYSQQCRSDGNLKCWWKCASKKVSWRTKYRFHFWKNIVLITSIYTIMK